MGYDKAKIYKLVNDTLGLTYYGCTINTLRQRLDGHKNKGNTCSSKILFQGEGEVKIYLVEEYPTDNRDLLKMRERYYIESNDCVNKCIPGRTEKEYSKQYRINNKDIINQNKKEYYEINKDKIKQNQKEYYEINKVIINEKCIQYNELNKEKNKLRFKQYYEINKDKLNERRRQKYKEKKMNQISTPL